MRRWTPWLVAVVLATSCGSEGVTTTVTSAPQPVVECDGVRATIVGTEGDDVLIGTAGDDVIAALGGNDTIDAGDGDDLVCPGPGDDRVEVGPGDDTLIATAGGSDTYSDAGGRDTIDFSSNVLPVAIALDADGAQRVDSADSVVTLSGGWEDYVGSSLGDAVIVGSQGENRRIIGGADDTALLHSGGVIGWDGTTLRYANGGSIEVVGMTAVPLAEASIVVDDTDPGFSSTGFFDSDPAYPQGYLGGVRFGEAGSGATARWVFGDVDPGIYLLSATWTAAPDRATDAPFSIDLGDGRSAVFTVNQEVEPEFQCRQAWPELGHEDGDFTVDWRGLAWFQVPFYLPDGGLLSVGLGSDADEYVVADAVRLDPWPPATWDPGETLLSPGSVCSCMDRTSDELLIWTDPDEDILEITCDPVSS